MRNPEPWCVVLVQSEVTSTNDSITEQWDVKCLGTFTEMDHAKVHYNNHFAYHDGELLLIARTEPVNGMQVTERVGVVGMAGSHWADLPTDIKRLVAYRLCHWQYCHGTAVAVCIVPAPDTADMGSNTQDENDDF